MNTSTYIGCARIVTEKDLLLILVPTENELIVPPEMLIVKFFTNQCD